MKAFFCQFALSTGCDVNRSNSCAVLTNFHLLDGSNERETRVQLVESLGASKECSEEEKAAVTTAHCARHDRCRATGHGNNRAVGHGDYHILGEH